MLDRLCVVRWCWYRWIGCDEVGVLRLKDLAATYSPASVDAVPSALAGFTAEFGMGSGVSPPP